MPNSPTPPVPAPSAASRLKTLPQGLLFALARAHQPRVRPIKCIRTEDADRVLWLPLFLLASCPEEPSPPPRLWGGSHRNSDAARLPQDRPRPPANAANGRRRTAHEEPPGTVVGLTFGLRERQERNVSSQGLHCIALLKKLGVCLANIAGQLRLQVLLVDVPRAADNGRNLGAMPIDQGVLHLDCDITGQKTGPTHFREGASTLQRFGSNDENAHVCIGIKYVCMYHHVSIGMTTPCSYRDRLSQKGLSQNGYG